MDMEDRKDQNPARPARLDAVPPRPPTEGLRPESRAQDAPQGVTDAPVVSAILAAAGVGERLGSARAFLELGGRPLIWYSLSVFENTLEVDEVVLVVAPEELGRAREFVATQGFSKVREVVAGARDRGSSIWAGLRRVDPRTRIALIHDGARPLVTAELVLKGILRCLSTGSAVLAIPVRDSVRRVVHEFTTEPVDRKKLHLIQTPQVFRFETIYEAYRRGVERLNWPSDHATLVEELGEEINLVEGSVENIKITTPEDLRLAEAILSCRLRQAEAGDGRRRVTGPGGA